MEEAMEYDDIENPRRDAPENEQNPPDDVIVISEGEDAPEAINPDPGGRVADDDDDDGVLAKQAKLEVPEVTPETKSEEDEDDSESGQTCPICMDLWTNSGDHRLCCLRCGHLFGHSCVLRWLQVACTAGNRRCPQCNRKATVKHIRILYARSLSAVDTVENERLKRELMEMTIEKNRFEMEVTKCHIGRRLHEQQLATMSSRIAELERQQRQATIHKLNEFATQPTGFKFFLEETVHLGMANGCRVVDYNPWYGCVAASLKAVSPLISGFGVRKVDMETFNLWQFVLLHNQAIRDIAFHPSEKTLLLSVSFDKTVKILDVHNNIVAHVYPTDSQLWSGCWSAENSNTMLVGAANGSITEFDIRQTNGAVGVLTIPGDRTPVVSLATVPSNSTAGISRGGFIAAHLNSCYAYEQKNVAMWTSRQMFLDGPFVSVRYDAKNHHALISSRPNTKTPNAHHTVFTIDKGTEDAVVCNVIHTFNGGNSQQLMSRSCHINVGNETFVAAHQESTKSVPLWSVSSGKQVHKLSASDPVLDMCSFEVKNKIFLATLTSSTLRFFKNG